jgi:hypothetical protein
VAANAEQDPFRVDFRYRASTVVALFGEDGLWHVEARGRASASLFLDYAVADVLGVPPDVAVKMASVIVRKLAAAQANGNRRGS